MQTFTRTVATVLAGVASLLLVGCFEISEQYHFNADGSGKVVLDMGVSKQLEELASDGDKDPWKDMREDFKKAEEEAKKDPNVKSVTLEEKTTDEMRHFVVSVEVHDMTKATDTMKGIGDDSKDGPSGETDLTIARDGGKFTLNRIVSMGDDDDDDGQPGAEVMMKRMFAGRYYKIQIFGAEVTGEGGVQKEGYVEFEKPLSVLMGSSQPWTVNASIVGAGSAGGGTALYVVIGVVVVVIVIGAAVVMGGKKKAA